MAAINDITGDSISTKVTTEQYRNNFDNIFNKKSELMNALDQYQKDAMSFRLPTANHDYALLGLSGEVGELHSSIAKYIRDDSSDDALVTNVAKELGDILWFIAAIAEDYGFSLEYIAKKNIEKLSNRKCKGTIQGSGDER